MMQAASDIFLGWVHSPMGIDGVARDFYVRDFRSNGSFRIQASLLPSHRFPTRTHRGHGRRCHRLGQSSVCIRNAVAKPSVVTTPTSLPPCSYASGIIVSESIVRIAPAANARTNATVFGDECWKKL